MTTGVKTYNSAGQTTQKFDTKPPQPKIYDAILRSEGVAINTMSDGRPFIGGVRFELKGTANTEGGRNRSISHTFWLDTTAFKQDGIPSVAKADGIVPCARAMGEEVSLPEVTVSGADSEGNPRDMDMLDARAAKAWLQSHDGRALQLKTKLRADKNDPNIKYGAVAFFIEQQTHAAQSGGSVADEVVIP